MHSPGMGFYAEQSNAGLEQWWDQSSSSLNEFRQLFGEDIGPPGQLPDFCSQIG